jgi:transmembrane sensor
MKRSGNIVNFPDRSPVDEEAARWIVRVDEGELTDTERKAFEAWRAVPENATAYAALKDHWGEMDGLAGLAGGVESKPWVQPAAWAGAGLAAAALLGALFIGFGGQRAPGSQPAAQVAAAQPGVGLYTTQVGGLQKITLADGSVVTLNTSSRIEARITAEERSIRLLQGEAYFEVAHDASRPFRVYAGDGVTTAVGTAFSVHLDRNAVEVVVSQGRVSYARVADSVEPPVAFVSAGEAATFDDSITIDPIALPEVSRKLSWTTGQLEFLGDPLSSVVEDISRYTGVTFEFADPSLADMRVAGRFEVGRVEAMLDALETSFEVRVERVDDTHVRIARRR